MKGLNKCKVQNAKLHLTPQSVLLTIPLSVEPRVRLIDYNRAVTEKSVAAFLSLRLTNHSDGYATISPLIDLYF